MSRILRPIALPNSLLVTRLHQAGVATSLALAVALSPTVVHAQDAIDDTTVSFPASYFAEFAPITVNDMLNRVPGIELILQTTNSGSDGDRGLGASAAVLINGKRLAGKANEARAQLDRIAADEVERVEIIRGSSSGLDVQNAGQLVNIVLRASKSRSNITAQLTGTYFDDGQSEPGGSVAWSGQSGNWTYLVSGEVVSKYVHTESFEDSINGDFSHNETIEMDRFVDQTNYTLNSNLTYAPTNQDRIAFNLLYAEADPPSTIERLYTDFNTGTPIQRFEREDIPATTSNWEFGGDYQHNFASGSRFKFLVIANEKQDDITRERFRAASKGAEETKVLYLDTSTNYQERILRSSYTMNLAASQGLEFGLEVAETTQDNALRQGVRTSQPGVPEYGGLTPVKFSNAFSTIQELRYEPFVVHNWQLNPRMSLESSVVVESSEIKQTGDLHVTRSFNFVKPKLDYRFDINASMQFKATLEQFVSQLSFADFSRATNTEDDDKDTIAGNPTLNPEESLRAELSLDYRLPNDGGALNARYFYYDYRNKIAKIDISPSPTNLQTTNGNVGPAEAFGIVTNASVRLGMLGLPQVLVTGALTVQESQFDDDPLTPIEHGFRPFDRGSYRLGFRHDVPRYNLNYGVNFNARIEDGRHTYDIDNRYSFFVPSNLSLFVEKQGWAGLTYRFEGSNLADYEGCWLRRRYDGYVIVSNLIEQEQNCSTTGRQYTLSIRGTF
jgi:outer membrane receptor for ferrienterochelin and colicins